MNSQCAGEDREVEPREGRQELHGATLENGIGLFCVSLLSLLQASGLLALGNIILIKTFTLSDRISLMKDRKA